MTISLTPPLAVPRRRSAAVRPRAGLPVEGLPAAGRSTARGRALFRHGSPDVVTPVPVHVTTTRVPGPGGVTALPRPGWSPTS